MNLIQTLILSVVEGITEFLPISSTGHLILASKLLRIPQTEFTKSFEIIIQLGAILAVAALYWKTLWTNKKLWLPLISAFVPTAIVGLTLYPVIKGYFLENSMVTTINLFLGGVFLIGFEHMFKNRHKQKDTQSPAVLSLSVQSALIIGICQSISVMPGVSRAAATIIGGLLVGLSRKDAVEFSFLLALPTMAAATGLDLLKTSGQFSTQEFGLLALGSVVAWITATIAIKTFLTFVRSHDFTAFGIYRILLSASYFFYGA